MSLDTNTSNSYTVCLVCGKKLYLGKDDMQMRKYMGSVICSDEKCLEEIADRYRKVQRLIVGIGRRTLV